MADAQIIPAMPPPPGKTSNFVDPEYQGTKFIVVNCVFLPLAVVALVVRTWTRVCIVRNFQDDDCMRPRSICGRMTLTSADLMIIALILSVVMTAVTLDMLNWGLGKHMWDVPAIPSLSPWFMKVRPFSPGLITCILTDKENMIAAIFYCAATGVCKVSVLVFYLRVFPSRSFHFAV